MWRCAPWARAGHRHHVSRDRGAVRRWPASVTILLSSFLFVAVHSVQNQAGCVVWPRCGRISVHVCQDGVKVEIVNSERQTGPDRETARSGRERDFGRFSGLPPTPLAPCAMAMRPMAALYMVRFGGCSPRRGFSAQQSHNDTHSLFMFSLCVPAYCFFVKLLL